MKVILLVISSLVLTLVSCLGQRIASVYVFELTVVNVGQEDASGMDVYFGSQRKDVGALDGNRKFFKVHDFFEAKIPYPTSVQYTPGLKTTDNRVEIKKIKIIGELKRGVPNQTLLVEVDTTNRTAVCTVGKIKVPKD